MTNRRIAGAAALAAVPMIVLACSSSNGGGNGSSPSRSVSQSGSTAGANSSATAASSSSVGATSSATSTTRASSAASCSDAGTLYTRLGGHAGIRAAIDQIVAAELGDADIKTYFFNQVQTPVPAGHPNAAQIEECFTDLLGSAAGGPESYPPNGGVTDDAGANFMCRDMATIHQPLLISGGTFDKFVTIAAGVLQNLGVSSCDIATIGGVLVSTKPAIVTSSLADAGAQPLPGASDGGDQ